MPKRLMQTLSVLALSVFFVPAGMLSAQDAPGQDAEPEVVELGRQFKAMPWLEHLDDVPFEIVAYDSIPFLAGLPAETEYYQIDPEVVVSAYSYFFCVRGNDADYIVGSVVNLVKLCRELEVIEELKKRNKGKEFALGVGESLKKIGTGLGSLVMHPGLSLKSAGDRIRQTGRSLERAIGAEEKVGRDESGANRSLLGEGPAGADRRLLAYELGIDVYTSNPVMQEALVDLSQLRKSGGLTTFAIPYGIGTLSSFNPLSEGEETELRIRDFSPYELRRLVGKELEPLFGMDREDKTRPLNALLYNPNYTPRSIAYIGADFMHLGPAGNKGMILELLVSAETPEEADMLALELRLYSFLHRRIEPIRSFLPFRSIFAAVGDSGKVYILLATDTIRPWEHTADAFGEILYEAINMRATGLEIWTLGDVDPGMVENAARHGVAVRQNILRNPRFFPMVEQRTISR
ncbi:MAG: hypothetical protein FWG74_04545 [Planctomycetes bacterium]|nr:hypothetical protein [Planctomycetota bacterium]